jgi:hypothetical protein
MSCGSCPPAHYEKLSVNKRYLRSTGTLRDLLGHQVLDLLLERSKDGKGGLRLTGQGSMLGELVKAVLERALEAELSSHLGYGKHDPARSKATMGMILLDRPGRPSRSAGTQVEQDGGHPSVQQRIRGQHHGPDGAIRGLNAVRDLMHVAEQPHPSALSLALPRSGHPRLGPAVPDAARCEDQLTCLT